MTKTVGEVRERECGVWIVGANGPQPVGELQDYEPEIVAPAIRIVTMEFIEVARDVEDVKVLGYSCRVEISDGPIDGKATPYSGISWRLMYPGANETPLREEKRSKAFGIARVRAGSIAYKRYQEAFEKHDMTESMLWRQLMGVLRDEAGIEEKRIAGKKITRYEWLEGEDLFLCLTMLSKHFAELDASALVAFRFKRDTIDMADEFWTKGKNVEGDPMVVQGQASKVPAEKAELLRGSIGYAPDFLVTFCYASWKIMSKEKRLALIYHELCHCAIDERGNPFIAAHDAEEFVAVAKQFGAMGIGDKARELVQETMIRSIATSQLELFAGVDIDTVYHGATVETATLDALPVSEPAEAQEAASQDPNDNRPEWERFIDRLDNLMDRVDDLRSELDSTDGDKFCVDRLETLGEIRETIKSRESLTKKQIVAVDNISDAVDQWFDRLAQQRGE